MTKLDNLQQILQANGMIVSNYWLSKDEASIWHPQFQDSIKNGLEGLKKAIVYYIYLGYFNLLYRSIINSKLNTSSELKFLHQKQSSKSFKGKEQKCKNLINDPEYGGRNLIHISSKLLGRFKYSKKLVLVSDSKKL